MNLTRPLTLAAVALVAAAPAVDAAPRKPKKQPLWRITTKHKHVAKEITDCKSIVSDQYRVKETTTTVTEYKETGRFPTGKQLRTGSRQTTLTRESTDPYLPSTEITNPPRYFTEVFQPGQWEYELKGGYLIYDYEDADGDFARARIRAPQQLYRTVKKTLKDTGYPPRQSDSRCNKSAEWTQTEQIEIYRVQ